MNSAAGVLLAQAVEIARKDLRAELRSGEALLVAAPFGATALLLVPLAVGADVPLLRQLGPGVYWLVVLLFGTLVTLRQTAVDGHAQLELLALLGVDPAARFLGRTAASAVLLLGFQTALVPVMIVLYDPPLDGWPWLVTLAPLVAVGLATLGTLAGALTANLQARGTLAPLLVAPLSLPLLLGATQVLEGARYGRGNAPWVLLVLTMDLIVVLAGAAGARPLEEMHR